MNTKDNILNDSSFQKLLHNDNYYQHIFKKTEKIVSVVFYIINNIDFDKKSETQISNLASKAHLTHEHALRTLEARQSSAKEILEQFAQALIGLDSTLRVASAMSLISSDVLTVVVNEIDAVLRGINSYIGTDSFSFAGSTDATVTPAKSKPAAVTSSASTGPKTDSVAKSTAADRRQRIITILEAKGEATIKDISEIITDCSEKTIQRELNTLIEDNQVKRQGERRWSRYSLF